MINIRYMGIINLNSDSFYAPSRVSMPEFLDRIDSFVSKGATILDLGAVSTRPGAKAVSVDEEWSRLEPALSVIKNAGLPRPSRGSETTEVISVSNEYGIATDTLCPRNDEVISVSIDTTSSQIVKAAYEMIGDFIVNDISAGEDDPQMLSTVGEYGLEYIAMHKRGTPYTMDSMCDYPNGIVEELISFFKSFEIKALEFGIKNWILDPGLGFAKTIEQNWEILHRLDELTIFNKPILIGAADKRFTGGDNDKAHRTALESLQKLKNAPEIIFRVHNI